ncbi:sulfatase [bacterium]|nr:sulfatase [bacterium]
MPAVVAGSGLKPGSGPEPLPNIIIILTDDQGYADTGCTGAKGYSTPNLDRMAAEGMRFTDFYAGCSVCTPSRASLLTGCYAPRVGLPHVIGPSGPSWTAEVSKTGLNSSETTIAGMLKTLGYATACFGKWHLGHHPEFLPTRHGFDEYFGLPYSNDMIPDMYPPLPLIDGEETVGTDPDQTRLTTWYTERALQFIEKNRSRPFFLYVPHSMPHIPLAVSEKYKGKTGGLYGDVIMEIDWSVGEILKKVEQLDLEKKTLVIFTSDNGPWLRYGNHAGSALPLREGKMTTFDGGQRVPCIMRWPGKIPAGSICHEMASNIDFLPTIAALTGAALSDTVIDGKDIRGLLYGGAEAKTPHDALYFYRGNELQAVRSGSWKLHFAHSYTHPVQPGKDGTPGSTEDRDQPLALYDLDRDIGETTDVSASHPDVVRRLSDMAEKFDAELKNNIRPPGRTDG